MIGAPEEDGVCNFNIFIGNTIHSNCKFNAGKSIRGACLSCFGDYFHRQSDLQLECAPHLGQILFGTRPRLPPLDYQR